MASKEAVIFAYRYLLGREPENEWVVTEYAEEASDWRVLREKLMASYEFRTQFEDKGAVRPPSVSLCAPPMSVEVDTRRDKLEALFEITAAQWRNIGETEPHWSVLTQDRYTQDRLQENREEFHASGAFEIELFNSALARSGVTCPESVTCLEFGCGVGRVTAHLAKRFERVMGVDVSPAHLKIAIEYLHSQGISNVELRQLQTVDEVLSLGKFDVVFCRLVLQHNTPPVMAQILRNLLASLNPGGIALVQIPTYCSGYRFHVDEYLANPDHGRIETHYFPQYRLLQLIAESNCRILEVKEDDSVGQAIDSISNSLLIQKWE